MSTEFTKYLKQRKAETEAKVMEILNDFQKEFDDFYIEPNVYKSDSLNNSGKCEIRCIIEVRI